MKTKLVVSCVSVQETLETLRRSGRRQSEGVVLWLGHRGGEQDIARSVYEPIHTAAVDFFHIPPHGVDALMNRMDETGTCVVAQVHSHPAAAFHSRADDEWAIVRHIGAFSIVVPDFAARTTEHNFAREALIFQLGSDNRWHPVGAAEILEVTT